MGNMSCKPDNKPHLSTNQFALLLAMQPQSIRKRWSQTGSYFGVQPIKLRNRKLAWPANALEVLAKSRGEA